MSRQMTKKELLAVFEDLQDNHRWKACSGLGCPEDETFGRKFAGRTALIELQEYATSLCLPVYFDKTPERVVIGGLELAVSNCTMNVPVKAKPIGPKYFATFVSMDPNTYGPWGNDADEPPTYWHEEIARCAPKQANAYHLGAKVGELTDSAKGLCGYFCGFDTVKLHFYKIGYYNVEPLMANISKTYARYLPRFPVPKRFGGDPRTLPRR